MSEKLDKESIVSVKLTTEERNQIFATLKQTIPEILKAVDANIDFFDGRFPDAAARGGVYPVIENVEWTTSFWTGQLWLAYEWTGEGKYRHLAEQHIRSFGQRIVNRDHTNHHDLGFLYSLSCVSGYRLTGNESAKYIALLAANALMERFHEKCGIIQAWGELNDPEQEGRMIIDCNMNLPLLYWASCVSGEPRYAQAARRHIKQAQRYIIRPDSSTFHTFYMDTSSGEPRFGNTQQGFSDDSCWSRGQAWGVYGFLLNYLYTRDDTLLQTSQRLANYFINRLPEDLVCYWDLALTSPDEYKDSSASAIVACALLELVKHLPPAHPDRETYESLALLMISNMVTAYFNSEHVPGAGLLKHSVYHLKGDKGVDECCAWGDYFFMEALTRALRNWHSYW